MRTVRKAFLLWLSHPVCYHSLGRGTKSPSHFPDFCSDSEGQPLLSLPSSTPAFLTTYKAQSPEHFSGASIVLHPLPLASPPKFCISGTGKKTNIDPTSTTCQGPGWCFHASALKTSIKITGSSSLTPALSSDTAQSFCSFSSHSYLGALLRLDFSPIFPLPECPAWPLTTQSGPYAPQTLSSWNKCLPHHLSQYFLLLPPFPSRSTTFASHCYNLAVKFLQHCPLLPVGLQARTAGSEATSLLSIPLSNVPFSPFLRDQHHCRPGISYNLSLPI